METTAPEEKVGRFKRSELWRGRNVSLDRATDEMLRELSGGKISAYLRRLIAIEYGRLLERGKSEQG